MPILGAFRFAYEINSETNKAQWKYSPIELFEDYRIDIIKCLISVHNEVGDVSLTGKKLDLWERLEDMMKARLEIRDLKRQMGK